MEAVLTAASVGHDLQWLAHTGGTIDPTEVAAAVAVQLGIACTGSSAHAYDPTCDETVPVALLRTDPPGRRRMEEWTAARRELWVAGQPIRVGRFTFCRSPGAGASGPTAIDQLHLAASNRRPALARGSSSCALFCKRTPIDAAGRPRHTRAHAQHLVQVLGMPVVPEANAAGRYRQPVILTTVDAWAMSAGDMPADRVPAPLHDERQRHQPTQHPTDNIFHDLSPGESLTFLLRPGARLEVQGPGERMVMVLTQYTWIQVRHPTAAALRAASGNVDENVQVQAEGVLGNVWTTRVPAQVRQGSPAGPPATAPDGAARAAAPPPRVEVPPTQRRPAVYSLPEWLEQQLPQPLRGHIAAARTPELDAAGLLLRCALSSPAPETIAEFAGWITDHIGVRRQVAMAAHPGGMGHGTSRAPSAVRDRTRAGAQPDAAAGALGASGAPATLLQMGPGARGRGTRHAHARSERDEARGAWARQVANQQSGRGGLGGPGTRYQNTAAWAGRRRRHAPGR